MRRTSAVRVLAWDTTEKRDTSPLCRNAQPIIFLSKVNCREAFMAAGSACDTVATDFAGIDSNGPLVPSLHEQRLQKFKATLFSFKKSSLH